MTLKTQIIYFLLFISIFAGSVNPVIAQENNEIGIPPLVNYSIKQYKGAPQNWAAIQDKRGFMYFANNTGILEFDGENWRIIKVANETNVRSLAIDSSGVMYIGAYDDFGFLAPDSSGNLEYVSLANHVSSQDLQFGDVWDIQTTTEGVYFQSSGKIFLWDGAAIKSWQAQARFHKLFSVHNKIITDQPGLGLFTIEGGNLMPIKGTELFSKVDVLSIIPYKKEQVLLATRTKGLFLLSFNDIMGARFTPFPTEVDLLIKEQVFKNIVQLRNGNFSIGTTGNGIIILDSTGRFVQNISKKSGLADDVIQSQYVDKNGNLWLSLSNGLAKIDAESPITLFNDKMGIEGTIEAIIRFNNGLYVASGLGLYNLISGHNTFTNQKKFKLLHSGETWHLLNFKYKSENFLLVAFNSDIKEVNKDHEFKSIAAGTPFYLYQSKFDSSRVYIGNTDGLIALRREKGKWINEGRLEGVKEEIRHITEDEDGNLWLGTNTNGVIKLTVPGASPLSEYKGRIITYNEKNGLPNGNVIAFFGKKMSFFATSEGIYLQKEEGKFEPDTLLWKSFTENKKGIHRISEDKDGNIWLVTFSQNNEFEVSIVSPTSKSIIFNNTPFREISKDLILGIFQDEDNVTWLGGPNGLFRYDAKASKNYKETYTTAIRRVILGEDSVIFGGAYSENNRLSLVQPENQKPILNYANNAITFEFASQNYGEEGANFYSYTLEGFDKTWTEWKHETKAVYTNLPEGTYQFRVKAKNIYKHESTESLYEFTILPPWYRTWWAYIAYVLLFALFVYGAVTVSTRGLRAIVKERTAEIVQQKELVEHKNKDIMDSINYAKRIQSAILPSEDIISLALPHSMILFKPKDVVSGDFYWFTEKQGKAFIAAADCTGHGVPGAFMSMIGNSLLNEIVNEKNITEPDEILNNLRAGIIRALKQTGAPGENKDGMDISLVSFELPIKSDTVKFQYAGANNPLYLFRKNGGEAFELTEIKGNKQPIGIYGGGEEKPFTKHEFELKKGDTIYLFTDGYADQFGGEKGKKFKYSQLKELLLSIQDKPMHTQREILEQTMANWTGDIHEQIDDICVIGVRV